MIPSVGNFSVGPQSKARAQFERERGRTALQLIEGCSARALRNLRFAFCAAPDKSDHWLNVIPSLRAALPVIFAPLMRILRADLRGWARCGRFGGGLKQSRSGLRGKKETGEDATNDKWGVYFLVNEDFVALRLVDARKDILQKEKK